MSSKRNRLDSILVVDLEATCWEREGNDKSPPEGQRNDILEIGICNLNTSTGKISDKSGFIIKPALSEVSEFCTSLTSITPEMAARGMKFEHACNKIKKDFGTKNKVWVSWGDYDRKHFSRDCNYYKVPYPFGPRHINAKTLFSLVYGLGKELGLMAALDYLGLDFTGNQHRGCDDAYNTARVFWKTIRRYG